MIRREKITQRYSFSICSCLCFGLALVQTGCQPDSTAEAPADAPAAAAVVSQQALAGVGKKGQSLNDNTGVASIISGPASVLFKVEQKVVLEIQIPQALQLFKATEGRFPASHQEFMQKIVQANRLQLPELPEGAVYRFEPDKGELWVHPAE